MRVVALISGGKDSTFNMLNCQAEGHQVFTIQKQRYSSVFI